MGCICSKGTSSANEYVESQRDKEFSKSSKPLVTPSRREEIVIEFDNGSHGGSNTTRIVSTPPSQDIIVPKPVFLDEREIKPVTVVNGRPMRAVHQRRATMDIGMNGVEPHISRIVSLPHGAEGEQVAAGWPSWLTAVAGEAIKGWVPRRADSFEKLDKIGQGTYSNVYRARDLETGKIVALKKVRFVNMDPESVRFMAREIYILRKLDHPNVVKLEGLVTSRMSCSLYLVFEYMEHDLAGLAASPDVKFTEAQIKCYMQQLLRGLEHCHSRGVLHRDIKGSNLLIDDNGILRIADFGLATFFSPEQKQPLTSRVVTLWYRPPELLLGATEYAVGVDLWSSGCILAELLAGKPIMPGRTEVEQLHKIFKLCGSPSEEYWRKSRLPHATIFKPQHPYRRCVAETFKDFPSSALALMDVLLAIEPDARGSASSALKSDFFTTRPHPCDPSSLPKYQPSKEFDAKLRDEEARSANHMEIAKCGHVIPVLPPSYLLCLIQRRQGHTNPKSNSDKYNPHEDGGSGFLIEPPRVTSHSGLVHPSAYGPPHTSGSSRNGQLRAQRSHMPQGASTDLANLSGLVAARSRERSTDSHWPDKRFNQLDDAESCEKQEWNPHILDRPTSSHKKGGDRVFPKKNRIHYSGPLMPPGGNMEEMLKEHERQIQQAVRKARLDKAKTKKNGDYAQSEALLYSGRNGSR
ncbi:hypothetical protein GIB67_041283 [Kingdonia uniflora]|uniref:Protein kinase domain-containing protein n=1 Tax=Kingdonia uniflora TaxID=39325 RepID=A0A7J7NJF3_9MAGN|nr:hypothetical protein GIB67_041283 [Kingdonia uniflora]